MFTCLYKLLNSWYVASARGNLSGCAVSPRSQTALKSSYRSAVEIWNKRICCLESWPDNSPQSRVMWLLSERPYAFQFNSCACPWQPEQYLVLLATAEQWNARGKRKYSNNSVSHLVFELFLGSAIHHMGWNLLFVSLFRVFHLRFKSHYQQASLTSLSLPPSLPVVAPCCRTNRPWACWGTARVRRPCSGYKCSSLSVARTPTSSSTATSRSATTAWGSASLWVSSFLRLVVRGQFRQVAPLYVQLMSLI